ncbi:hypothetical protein EDB83DRAFT_758224 [Lactarius deliciosus]|nr:hypothetical protein EDB83DRAFT_758224 [Lactarius deliciosus]
MVKREPGESNQGKKLPRWHSDHGDGASPSSARQIDITPTGAERYSSSPCQKIDDGLRTGSRESSGVRFVHYLRYIFQFAMASKSNHRIKKGITRFFIQDSLPPKADWHFVFVVPIGSRSISCPQSRGHGLKALLDEINVSCLTSRLNNDPVRRYPTRRGLVYLYHFSVVTWSPFRLYVHRILPRIRLTRLTLTCLYNSTVGATFPLHDFLSRDQLVRPHTFFFRTTGVALWYVRTCGLTVFPTRRMYIINASYDHCRPLVYFTLQIREYLDSIRIPIDYLNAPEMARSTRVQMALLSLSNIDHRQTLT